GAAARTAKPDRPLWVLADPIFDRADPRLNGLPAPPADPLAAAITHGDGQGFRRLPHTRQEGEAGCRALKVPVEGMWRDERAVEGGVKAASRAGELARARFVHFATHGVAGQRMPESGLVLNLVGNDYREQEGGLNDGFLRLSEVALLRLNA